MMKIGFTRLWVFAETVWVSLGFQTTISASDPTAIRPENRGHIRCLTVNYRCTKFHCSEFPPQAEKKMNQTDTFTWVHVEEFGSVRARYSDKLVLIHLPRTLQDDKNQDTR